MKREAATRRYIMEGVGDGLTYEDVRIMSLAERAKLIVHFHETAAQIIVRDPMLRAVANTPGYQVRSTITMTMKGDDMWSEIGGLAPRTHLVYSGTPNLAWTQLMPALFAVKL